MHERSVLLSFLFLSSSYKCHVVATFHHFSAPAHVIAILVCGGCKNWHRRTVVWFQKWSGTLYMLFFFFFVLKMLHISLRIKAYLQCLRVSQASQMLLAFFIWFFFFIRFLTTILSQRVPLDTKISDREHTERKRTCSVCLFFF